MAYPRRRLDPACPLTARLRQAALPFRVRESRTAASRPASASMPPPLHVWSCSRLRGWQKAAAPKAFLQGGDANPSPSCRQGLPTQAEVRATWRAQASCAEPAQPVRWPEGQLALQREAESPPSLAQASGASPWAAEWRPRAWQRVMQEECAARQRLLREPRVSPSKTRTVLGAHGPRQERALRVGQARPQAAPARRHRWAASFWLEPWRLVAMQDGLWRSPPLSVLQLATAPSCAPAPMAADRIGGWVRPPAE